MQRFYLFYYYRTVRTATICVFGSIIIQCTEPEVRNRRMIKCQGGTNWFLDFQWFLVISQNSQKKWFLKRKSKKSQKSLEITGYHRNHWISQKSLEITGYHRNHWKSPDITEITENHRISQKSLEITGYHRNHRNHWKSPDITEITENHWKPPDITEITGNHRNHRKSQESSEIIRNH